MKSSVWIGVLTGIASLAALGSAVADECQTAGALTQVVGTVVVDKGQGFAPAVVGASLQNGDKVAVQGSGSAVVDFGKERTVTVPGSTTATLRAPGCGVVLDETRAVIVGTVAIGVGIAAAIAASDGGSNRTPFFPVSP